MDMEKIELATSLFTPRQAIKTSDQLSGRQSEIAKILQAIKERGAHAIIFGDRGVGKTSLANCVANIIVKSVDNSVLVVPPINCDSADDFASLWEKVFTRIKIHREQETINFIPAVNAEQCDASEFLGQDSSPHNILNVLRQVAGDAGIVVMIDEFDRTSSKRNLRRLLADTIKALSDQDVNATLIVIGVAESVPDLLHEHASIIRHVVEVSVPRLTRDERVNLVEERLQQLGLDICTRSLNVLVSISKGLPYYVHLLGQKACLCAIMDESESIEVPHVMNALQLAIDESMQLIKDCYNTATRSAQPSNRYPHTLLACAMARTDEFGYFKPGSVCAPLELITGKKCTVGSFSDRLKHLAAEPRGNVLVQSSKKYDVRYRFSDPLMEPFVVMKGLYDELIDSKSLVGSL